MAQPKKGSQIGNYRLEEQVGRGGMGVVYRATHLALDRQVAIKLIAEDLSEEEGFRERFRREPKIAASIDHPNVIPVFDAGEAEGHLFVAMRLVEGSDLGTLLRDEGGLEPKRAAAIAAQVAEALDAAHDRGLVHRDVKPANVLLEQRGGREHVYLTDFGITKGGGGSVGLTRTGQWVGTADYVAPEQIEGEEQDRRSDVYALGAVLFHTLTGEAPYSSESEVAKIYAHLQKPPRPITDIEGVTPELDAVMRRAMEKKPADRFPTAGEFATEATAAATGRGKLSKATRALIGAGEVSSETKISTKAPETSLSAPAPETAAPAAAPKKAAPKKAAPKRKAAPKKAPAKPARVAAAGGGVGAGAGGGPGETVMSGGEAAERGLPSLPRPKLPSLGRAAVPLAALGVVALGVLGFVLGSSGGGEESVSLENSASSDSVELGFPGDWSRTDEPVPIPGIEFSDPLGLAPDGEASGAGVVAGEVQADGPTLLPQSFLALLETEPPAGDPVDLSGVQAYRYEDLKPTGFDGTVTLFTAPTSAGVTTLACAAPAGAEGSLAEDCSAIATTLKPLGAEPLPVGADPAYAEAVNAAIGSAQQVSADQAAALGSAKTAEQQAGALEPIARAYGKAAADLKAAAVSPTTAAANAGLVDALEDFENAYGDMASAAEAGDEDGYDSARGDVDDAAKELQKALASLEELGYNLS